MGKGRNMFSTLYITEKDVISCASAFLERVRPDTSGHWWHGFTIQKIYTVDHVTSQLLPVAAALRMNKK